MEQDNVPEPGALGFEALQMSPRAVEDVLFDYAADGQGDGKT